MNGPRWQFFIDVGGTFTDLLCRRPDGTLVSHKLLSSGVVRGVAGARSSPNHICDPHRCSDPADCWTGFSLNLLAENGAVCASAPVKRFDRIEGLLHVAPPLTASFTPGCAYELRSHEEAPVVAIRYVMGLRLTQPVGAVDVRLGTTRSTNALLERKGARTAFVTTKGFADVLKIGNQDRPDLFRLEIRKRSELAKCAVEIDERISAAGGVLRPLDEDEARRQLLKLKEQGIESLAVCLLHAHVNPHHK